MLLPYFQAIENGPIGEAIRDSTWLFPFIEAFHLVGLAVIGGAVLLVDFRLLGSRPEASAGGGARARRAAVDRRRTGVHVSSGVLLFLAESVKCYYSAAFWIKMTALLLAIVFTFTVRRRITTADRQECQSVCDASCRSDVDSVVGHRGLGGTVDWIFVNSKFQIPNSNAQRPNFKFSCTIQLLGLAGLLTCSGRTPSPTNRAGMRRSHGYLFSSRRPWQLCRHAATLERLEEHVFLHEDLHRLRDAGRQLAASLDRLQIRG
jgi:hypothetical protein